MTRILSNMNRGSQSMRMTTHLDLLPYWGTTELCSQFPIHLHDVILYYEAQRRLSCYLHIYVISHCLNLRLNLFWRMTPSGMSRRVTLVRTNVSEEPSASFIRVTRIGELGTTLAVTSNRRTLRRNNKWEVLLRSERRLLVIASVVRSSPILVTVMKEALNPQKLRFLQEPHGVTS
jgi:hypothetical protein